MDKLLVVNDLTVRYKTHRKIVEAVNNISFTIGERETLGLVGETGAGKTTTALAIMRLIPVPPGEIVSGQITLNGQSLLDKKKDEMRKIRGGKVSMIFQDPMTSLNPVITVGEQIAEVIRLHNRISLPEAVLQAKKMLESVGIPSERFSEYPYQFSGGMRQRVVIAIALACTPQLIIADEPTTALDVTIQAQILDLIAGLKEKLGTSMMLITHDLGVVAQVCDRVAIMYAGEIVETGTKFQIYKNAAHPYTIGLFSSLPDLRVESYRLRPITGSMPDPSKLPRGCHFAPRCPRCTAECGTREIRYSETESGHLVKCIRAGQDLREGVL